MNENYYKDVTIPKKIYVGVGRGRLSIATKWDESPQNNIRYETLVRSHKGKKEDISLLDNVPYSGFSITKITSTDWIVKDPRGFTIKVPESTVLRLMTQCVLDHGEVVSKCQWAWKRGLILVSVSDPFMDKMIKNTTLEHASVDVSKISIGDVVSTKSHGTMKYLGKFDYCAKKPRLLSDSYYSGSSISIKDSILELSSSKKFFFEKEEYSKKVIKSFSIIKIVEVLEKNTEKLADDHFKDLIKSRYQAYRLLDNKRASAKLNFVESNPLLIRRKDRSTNSSILFPYTVVEDCKTNKFYIMSNIFSNITYYYRTTSSNFLNFISKRTTQTYVDMSNKEFDSIADVVKFLCRQDLLKDRVPSEVINGDLQPTATDTIKLYDSSLKNHRFKSGTTKLDIKDCKFYVPEIEVKLGGSTIIL